MPQAAEVDVRLKKQHMAVVWRARRIFVVMKRSFPSDEHLLKQADHLAQKTEKNRAGMIRAELTTISSFCDRADTEIRMKKREHAARMLREAKKGIRTAKDQVSKLPADNDERDGFLEEIDEIEGRVQQIEKAA